MEFTLEQLKEISTKLGFTDYHPNIGVIKLKEKLDIYTEEVGTTLEEVAVELGFIEQTFSTNNASVVITSIADTEVERLRNLTFATSEGDQSKKTEVVQTKEAMKLIRCMITCNNKNKTSHLGEIFCVRNGVIPEVKKFIPFGHITHIPQIMLNMIKEKEYQMVKVTKLANGNTIKKPFMIPEYSIQILDPITKDELEAIRKKQLAEGYTGE